MNDPLIEKAQGHECWQQVAYLEQENKRLIEIGTEVVTDLTGKVQWLLDNYITAPEGVFTFPDGDTWGVNTEESPWKSGRCS